MRIFGWLTVVLTYFLMVWGNLVSSTGSGLACPDWPLCHGTVAPPVSLPVVLEWGHRLLAFTATLFILITLYQVFFSKAGQGRSSSLKRSGRSLLILLGFQILLGGTTVLLGLSPVISTIHLMIATFVFSGLIAVACVVTWGNPVVKGASPKTRRLATAGLLGLLIQFCLGAWVRHTHSGLSCPNFPHCLDGFLPIPFTMGTATTFLHRWWGIMMLVLFLQLALAAGKSMTPLTRPARRAFGLAVAQVFLGIGTVLGGLNTESRAIHAAVGYALWGILFYIAIRAGGFRWLWEKPAGGPLAQSAKHS